MGLTGLSVLPETQQKMINKPGIKSEASTPGQGCSKLG